MLEQLISFSYEPHVTGQSTISLKRKAWFFRFYLLAFWKGAQSLYFKSASK